MKTLPTASELKSAFMDFARFTFELLEKIDSRPDYLKFAAVNSQIALELFLKYLYVESGKANEIQKTKRGVFESDFVDFSQILNHFYSSRTWSYGEKKELSRLIDIRNHIVHRGQRTAWDKELATSVIRTLFFIHATAWSEFSEPVLFENNIPHRISKNKVWRDGVDSFVSDLIDDFSAAPLTCLACNAYAVVNGEIMALEEGQGEEDLICLNCLTSINTEHEARLIGCYVCFEKAYLIDAFNEQEDQLHVAKCSECETGTWVRQCRYCETFYHPTASNEVNVNGFFFCEPGCAECYAEQQA